MILNVMKMTFLTPDWVAGVTSGIAQPKASPANDLVWDSREVRPGAAFMALPGAHTHGNLFLDSAVAAGAAFVLTEQVHPAAVRVSETYPAMLKLGQALRKRFLGLRVGVSGSVGKTSLKEALSQALGWPAPVGNLNTPAALTRFFLHLDPAAKGAVLELGIDRRGEMDELVELTAPQLGVLTTISPAHLQAFGNLSTLAAEKARLLVASELRLVSEQVRSYVHLPRTHVYGFKEGRFRGHTLDVTAQGSSFVYRDHLVRLPYPGFGPALAALGALACVELLEADLDAAIERLADLRLPQGRMQKVVKRGVTFMNDAYNASPLSVQLGLKSLAAFPERKVLLLGEMLELGSESEYYHLELARAAANLGQELIFMGRYAPAQLEAAGRGQAVADLDGALKALRAVTRAGDLVYLKASRAVGLEQILEAW